MSERGQHSGRGRGGGGRGGEHRGSRGGGRGAHQTNTERPKKENILDLGKYMDKKIIVKFNGGREGAYDGFLGCVQDVAFTYRPRKTLLARILAEAKYSYRYAKGLRCTYEFGAGRGMVLRDDEGNESSRSLGLVVVRGTLLVLVSPVDGSEEIANPFLQQDE